MDSICKKFWYASSHLSWRVEVRDLGSFTMLSRGVKIIRRRTNTDMSHASERSGKRVAENALIKFSVAITYNSVQEFDVNSLIKLTF